MPPFKLSLFAIKEHIDTGEEVLRTWIGLRVLSITKYCTLVDDKIDFIVNLIFLSCGHIYVF